MYAQKSTGVVLIKRMYLSLYDTGLHNKMVKCQIVYQLLMLLRKHIAHVLKSGLFYQLIG